MSAGNQPREKPDDETSATSTVRVVFIYPVRDFDEFCQQFALTDARRSELGVLATEIHRSIDNANEVMVTFEMRSTDDAMALFTADDRIRAWMDRAGVEVYPSIFVGSAVQDSTG
jgi:hypothetical protein